MTAMTITEMKVGQMVTVTANKDDNKDGNKNNSFIGDVLEVKAIQAPFVVVLEVARHALGSTFSIDTRSTEFMELKPEYVEAMTANRKSEHQAKR